LIGIYAEDQDRAERFYTEILGFLVKTSADYGDERWLSVVSAEERDGLELTLHLADDPARTFQEACRQIGRPVLSLRTDDCEGEAERLKAKGKWCSSKSPQGCSMAAWMRCSRSKLRPNGSIRTGAPRHRPPKLGLRGPVGGPESKGPTLWPGPSALS
jgi:catechol 2,3-dioxygenase-like lactoylglutathione lyase family enzyme